MNNENKRNTWKLNDFGKLVKKKLIEKEMTVSELAETIGTSRSFLSQVLYGDKKGSECTEKIKKVLNIEEDEEE